jgi:integrase
MAKNGNGDGSIYEHKRKGKKVGYRGAYTVYAAESPKRRYVSGKDREEVRRKLTDAMANRDKGLVFDDENVTIGEYLDRWLSDCVRGSVRESTFDRDSYLVRVHIKPALGHMKLRKLSPVHVSRASTETGSIAVSARQRPTRFIRFFTKLCPKQSGGLWYHATSPRW